MQPEDTSYDEGRRYLAKRGQGGLMLWLLDRDEGQVAFDSVADSVLVLRSGKGRICDVIARLRDLTRGGVPCAAVVEFQLTPDPDMLGRLLVAGGMVYLEMRPSEHPGDRYDLVAVVVNLTGKGDCGRAMAVGAAEWTLRPRESNLASLDAEAVLADVASGRAPGEVLAWVPLMRKGGEAATIDRWLEIVRREPDLNKRGDYALAVLFAGAVGLREVWAKRLEGLTMIEAPAVTAWKAEAAKKAILANSIELLVEFLETRLAPVPLELVDRVRASKDAGQVRTWYGKALRAASIEQFRQETGL